MMKDGVKRPLKSFDMLQSMSFQSTHDSDRTIRTTMKIQYGSNLEKKTWTKQLGTLNRDPKT